MRTQCVIQFEDDLAYVVKQPAVANLATLDPVTGGPFEPAVLIDLPPSSANFDAFLKARLDHFRVVDDVYHPIFADTGKFILQHHGELDYDPSELLNDYEGLLLGKSLIHCASESEPLPEGPYFRSPGGLFQAWRLFADDLRAFVLASLPVANAGQRSQTDYAHEPLQIASVFGDELAVAVPSRLYTPPSPDLPLNGKRISIKDNLHLSGVKTSMGSRAYVDMYGPQNDTAELVKMLIDKGAIIVGKTKMNAFSGGESPPNQAIDYFVPWNPRADGYQRPAGSSSGAGVSVAGYPWCDFAIGTDTTGSGREPARAVGVQGLRLTHNILPSDGLVITSEDFDCFAFMTRSLDDLYQLTSAVTEDKLDVTMPIRLLYPTDWFPYKIPEQQQMNEEFLSSLEAVLGVQHTKVSLTDLWEKSPPESADGKSIADYLANSGYWPMYYDNYHLFHDFRQGYKEKYKKEVYVSPPQRWKWELGSKITPEQRAEGLAECQVFKTWITEHVLTFDGQGKGEAVILLPLGNARPDYRDIVVGPPSVVKSYEPKYFASVLGLPQIVVPIGQIPYTSQLSGCEEWIPVITTLAGAQGSDLLLVKLAQMALQRAKWPTSVQTGRNCFEVLDGSGQCGDGIVAKLA